MEKLAALVPIPRVHLTRFHGCLAPHSKIRAKVVLKASANDGEISGESQPSRRRHLSWAQLLKRVFKIDLETCHRCGGKTKVIATIMDIPTIEAILGHLGLPTSPPRILPARAPSQ